MIKPKLFSLIFDLRKECEVTWTYGQMDTVVWLSHFWDIYIYIYKILVRGAVRGDEGSFLGFEGTRLDKPGIFDRHIFLIIVKGLSPFTSFTVIKNISMSNVLYAYQAC